MRGTATREGSQDGATAGTHLRDRRAGGTGWGLVDWRRGGHPRPRRPRGRRGGGAGGRARRRPPADGAAPRSRPPREAVCSPIGTPRHDGWPARWPGGDGHGDGRGDGNEEGNSAVRTRAAVLRRPETEYEIVELEVLDPGPGEVLVEMAYAGLCHSDEHLRHSNPGGRYPIVGGHEG